VQKKTDPEGVAHFGNPGTVPGVGRERPKRVSLDEGTRTGALSLRKS
jgi:hypothetical protein